MGPPRHHPLDNKMTGHAQKSYDVISTVRPVKLDGNKVSQF